MKKMMGTFAFILSLVFVLSGCGGGGGGSTPPPPDPNLGTKVTPTAMPSLSFLQTVVSANTISNGMEYFPGQPNIWTLDQDFAVENDQFYYGMVLIVGGPTGTWFPWDQTYDELTFYTPLVGVSEGIKAAVVSDGLSMNLLPITGHSAFLNATADSRLQQQILSLPTGTTISVGWTDRVELFGSLILGYEPNYKVVVKRLDGTVVKTLYNYNTSPLVTGEQTHSTAFNSLATPTTFVLSFEESSSTSWFAPSHVIIDKVTVKDKSGYDYATNGDFEDTRDNGLYGWTVSTPAEIQNITSGSRPSTASPEPLGGLVVTRSFYTVPDKLWGRWVDVFENKTVSQITTTISLVTVLSTTSGSAIIYSTPSTTDKALTSWDFLAQTSDIGLVFGNAASVEYVSDDGTGTGSDTITVSYSITVPAGGRVSIVNFALMSGTTTALTAAGDINAEATDVDTEAANIVNNFWTDWQYRKGMTQAQLDAVYNFPKP